MVGVDTAVEVMLDGVEVIEDSIGSVDTADAVAPCDKGVARTIVAATVLISNLKHDALR